MSRLLVAALLAMVPAFALAQVKIGDGTILTLPGQLDNCGEAVTRAGAGLIEHAGNCPDRGAGTFYQIAIGTGGTHFFAPGQRLSMAYDRAGTPKDERKLTVLARSLRTRGKPLALKCLLVVNADGEHEAACVRDEPETKIEIIVQAPTAQGAWSLLEDIGRDSEYR